LHRDPEHERLHKVGGSHSLYARAVLGGAGTRVINDFQPGFKTRRDAFAVKKYFFPLSPSATKIP